MKKEIGEITMNLTEAGNHKAASRERQALLAWAESNLRDPRADQSQQEKSSYRAWQGTGAREYGWDTMLQLKDTLEKRWEADPVKKQMAMTCAVAAYKLQSEREENEKNYTEVSGIKKQVTIPDFIYVF